jgi:hypothetical protein
VIRFESVKSGTRLSGDKLAAPPRLAIYRLSEHDWITSDHDEIEVAYTLSGTAEQAAYQAQVSFAGRPAVEFDVVFRLDGDDLVLSLDHVEEHGDFRFLSLRLPHIVSVSSVDDDALAATCHWQGRLLDPKLCRPGMVDYNWVGFTARPMGTAWRPDFLAILDVPGYEDLLIVDVWDYTQTDGGDRQVSLGAELMYRQRSVEGPRKPLTLFPPGPLPKWTPPAEPLLCGKPKTARIHFLLGGRKPLGWTDAAKWLQKTLAARNHCTPLYDNTLVYKIAFHPAAGNRPVLSFEQGQDIVRRIHDITDGMKQVCYFAGFQGNMGDSQWPLMSKVHPGVGKVETFRRIVKESRKAYNAIISVHGNVDVFSDDSPEFDWKYVARDARGLPQGQGVWGSRQLYGIAFHAYFDKLKKIIAENQARFGLRDTIHLDTYSGSMYTYDTHPDHPANTTEILAAKIKLVKEFRRLGLDVTSECLLDPYIPWIGHVWALFNTATNWQGEQAIPFANYIYHGAISWNSGRADSDASILNSLIQGGGSGMEFPVYSKDWTEVVNSLYLVHPAYMLLRNRRWSGYRKEETLRRVDYGTGSFIEVDDKKPGYRVVVDGRLIAKDFQTLFPGPRRGSTGPRRRAGRTARCRP